MRCEKTIFASDGKRRLGIRRGPGPNLNSACPCPCMCCIMLRPRRFCVLRAGYLLVPCMCDLRPQHRLAAGQMPTEPGKTSTGNVAAAYRRSEGLMPQQRLRVKPAAHGSFPRILPSQFRIGSEVWPGAGCGLRGAVKRHSQAAFLHAGPRTCIKGWICEAPRPPRASRADPNISRSTF